MWTEEHRARHAPRGGRNPSDLTDAEWALIVLLIPPPAPAGHAGRRRAPFERIPDKQAARDSAGKSTRPQLSKSACR